MNSVLKITRKDGTLEFEGSFENHRHTLCHLYTERSSTLEEGVFDVGIAELTAILLKGDVSSKSAESISRVLSKEDDKVYSIENKFDEE